MSIKSSTNIMLSPSIADNHIYLLCNEENKGILTKIKDTAQKTFIQNTPKIHVGFSSWLNYDIIALRDSDIAYICDINTNLLTYLDKIKDLILKTPDRNTFVNSFLKETPELDLFPNSLSEELKRPSCWLFDDKKFQKIKDLYRKNKIFHVCLNITDTEALNKLKSFHLNKFKSELNLDTLYTSNIYEWLSSSEKSSFLFKTNMQNLLNEKTIFIDAYNSTSDKSKGPPLRIAKGKLPSYPYILNTQKRKPTTTTNPLLEKDFNQTIRRRLDFN